MPLKTILLKNAKQIRSSKNTHPLFRQIPQVLNSKPTPPIYLYELSYLKGGFCVYAIQILETLH